MKASHALKIIRAVESCKTSDQYRSWLAWVKPMKLGEYHDMIYNIAIPKAWELCAQVSIGVK